MANIKITTTMGDITVRLYDETPLHRDNFVKLASEGYYDNVLFHRVIENARIIVKMVLDLSIGVTRFTSPI